MNGTQMEQQAAQQPEQYLQQTEASVQQMAVAQAETVKQARKHFSSIGLMYFLGTLIIYGVQYGCVALVKLLFPEMTVNADMALVITMVPTYVISMPLMMLLIKRIPAQQIERHRMSVGKLLLAFMMAYAIMFCSNYIGSIITSIISLVKGSAVNNVLQSAVTGVHPLIVTLFTVVCAPIMEELIFRKLLMDRAVRYGEGIAILLSGLMFGLFHGNLSQFIYAFTLGIFLGFIYIRTGNVKYTIILHMIINFIGTVVSVFILELIDLEAINAVTMITDEAEMLQAMMEVLPGMLLLLLFVFGILGIVIAGFVLGIVFLCQKKFFLKKVGITLPKGKRFVTVMINVGMILFTLFWIVMIIMQLFE